MDRKGFDKMSTARQRNDWRKWKDWQRALFVWECPYGRVGLSAHALATICNRPPKELFDEMLRHDARFFRCEAVGASLVQVAFKAPPSPTVDWLKWTIMPRRLCRNYPEERRRAKHAMEENIREFPWPEYKGISHDTGRKTTGLDQDDFRCLQKAVTDDDAFYRHLDTASAENYYYVRRPA